MFTYTVRVNATIIAGFVDGDTAHDYAKRQSLDRACIRFTVWHNDDLDGMWFCGVHFDPTEMAANDEIAPTD